MRKKSRFVLKIFTFCGLLFVVGGLGVYWYWYDVIHQRFVHILQQRGFPMLEGRIPVFYSEGFQSRASMLQAQVEEMLRFYRDNLGLDTQLYIAVLNQPDWESVTSLVPYGMIGVAGNPPVAGIPAAPGGEIYNSAMSLESSLSDEIEQAIQDAGCTYQEAVGIFIDLIAFHEVGHLLIDEYGINTPAKWLNELTASYFSYVYMIETNPTFQLVWNQVATNAYLHHVEPDYRTLVDFEKLYLRVGSHNYCWYQAVFNQRVQQIGSSQGIEFIKKMKELFPAQPESTDRMEFITLLRRLEAIAPGFQQWIEQNRLVESE